MKVLFIASKDCKDCKRMRDVLISLKSKNNFELVEYDSDDDESVDIAIKYGVSDIPACIVLGSSIDIVEGQRFDKQKIINVISGL